MQVLDPNTDCGFVVEVHMRLFFAAGSVVFGPTGFVCTKHALHIAGGSGGVRLIALQEMCKDSSNCCRL